MARQTLTRVLPQILRFLDAQAGRKQTDGCLLEQFITQRDEGAFALLVERHGTMVLRVCRRVLGDAHEAEDAFQATFLVLALRAGAVRRRESLGSWLYGVARRVAAKARIQSVRRRGREALSVAVAPVPTAPATEWTEFRGLLDEEVSRLPELYRRPLVLCCLEGKTQEQAAAELGCPRSSLASRLARAKEILRRRLTDRGVVPSGLTAVAARTASAAVHGAGVSGTPARILALAHGAMKALSATHLIVILSVTLFAGAGVVAAGALAAPAVDEKPAKPPATAPAIADAPEAVRIDRYGDPLPPGALMRLGTVRFRHGGNGLNDAAYSPDGKILATAGEIGRIHLWDAATGKGIAVLEGDKTTSFLSLAFSPDGKTLASGGVGFELPRNQGAWLPTKLTLWDMATRKPRLFFENEHDASGYQHGFHRLAYSPDGKWLAAGCDGSIRIWEVATAKEAPPILAGNKTIIALVFSPDSHTLVWGGYMDSDAVMWDVATRKEVRRLGGHKSSLQQLAYSPDGKLLAAAYEDKTIGLWDSVTGQEVRRLKGHESPVVSVAFSPDGKTLASAANAAEPVRLWDSATGDVRFQLRGLKAFNNFARVVFSPDGTTLAVAHQDGTVFLWNPATGKRLLAADEHEFMVSGIDLSPDGRTLATAGTWDKTIRLWDLATGRHIRTLSAVRGVMFPAFSPDGARISTVMMSGPPTVWETATGRELPALPIAADAWASTLNGTITAVMGKDETLRLLETATGKELQTFKGIGKQRTGGLSPDGKTLTTWTFPEWDGRQYAGGVRHYKEGPTIHLWSVATGQETHRIGDSKTTGVVFLPDGRTAALMEPGHVWFWDVGSGRQVRDLSDPGIGSCRLSPDGRTLATFDSTQSGIGILELATGRERLRLAGHAEGTWCVLFTPDGRRLITGGMDSTVLVWDLAPARPDTDKLNRLWSQLADDDAGHAYEAIWALSSAPGVVDFLKARLEPVSGAEAKEIHRLIADLDSDDFNEREKASTDLARIGAHAEDALLATLAGKPSLEASRRMKSLLESLEQHPAPLPAEELQSLRALEVLERIGSPDARRVLKTLAAGGEARLTREAQASLIRLDKTTAAGPASP
jgi:RNA polymerase sigma factor (sigma-70 family)